MTAGTKDNAENQEEDPYNFVSPPQYDTTSNDAFDVKVINHSVVYPWDGPGDGNSTETTPERYSPLLSADDAIANGALWVNAAGNSGESSWFSRDPVWRDNHLVFNPAIPTNACNYVTLRASGNYDIQMRWQGDWPSLNHDLSVHLYTAPNFGRQTLLRSADVAQHGRIDRDPYERLMYTPSRSDRYCIKVKRRGLTDAPAWLQVQVFNQQNRASLRIRSHIENASINNPAESDNESVISVGSGQQAWPHYPNQYSSKGPIPEPHPTGRSAPDVITVGNPAGTSFSAPRASGIAALAIQALGHLGEFDEPEEIARHLRSSAELRGYAANIRGLGLGLLRAWDLRPPTNVTLSYDQCKRLGEITARYERAPLQSGVALGISRVNVKRFDGQGQLTNEFIARGAYGRTNIETGHRAGTYEVTAQACTSEWYCGPESTPSNRITVADSVCRADGFERVNVEGPSQLRWEDEPNADRYELELTPVSSDRVEGEPQTIEVNEPHYTVPQNDMAASYRAKVRTVVGERKSDWTYTLEFSTNNDAAIKPDAPIRIWGIPRHSYTGPAIQLGWLASTNAARHEVRVWIGNETSGKWLRLSPRPESKRHPISAWEFNRSVSTAIVTGLQPGTDYSFKIRAANADEYSPWTAQTVSVRTDGARPVGRPQATATPPPNKAPARDLEYTLTGTTVNLRWTAHTNPDFQRQIVKRRVATSGSTWTEFQIGLTDTTYRDSTGEANTRYIYRVQGFTATSGPDGWMSNPVQVEIPSE